MLPYLTLLAGWVLVVKQTPSAEATARAQCAATICNVMSIVTIILLSLLTLSLLCLSFTVFSAFYAVGWSTVRPVK